MNEYGQVLGLRAQTDFITRALSDWWRWSDTRPADDVRFWMPESIRHVMGALPK